MAEIVRAARLQLYRASNLRVILPAMVMAGGRRRTQWHDLRFDLNEWAPEANAWDAGDAGQMQRKRVHYEQEEECVDGSPLVRIINSDKYLVGTAQSGLMIGQAVFRNLFFGNLKLI